MKLIRVDAPFRRYRRAQGNQPSNFFIRTRSPQARSCSKRKAAEQHRQMVFSIQPVQRGARVFHFTASLVVLALAQSCSAKIEAQHWKPKGVQRLHGVIHNFVVNSAAIKRMRMTDQCRVSGVRLAFVQQGFQLARRPLKEERSNATGHIFFYQRSGGLCSLQDRRGEALLIEQLTCSYQSHDAPVLRPDSPSLNPAFMLVQIWTRYA